MPFFKIPHLDQSFQSQGNLIQKPWDGHQFQVLIWNVFKGRGHRAGAEVFAQDFVRLSQDKSLILLQEGLWSENSWPLGLESRKEDFHWKMAASFEYKNFFWQKNILSAVNAPLPGPLRTGLMTGSQWGLHRHEVIRPTPREFFFLTPKLSLFTEYHILNEQEKLLVINAHFINFTANQHFRKFLNDLLESLRLHQGPLLFAGDFNTWSRGRLKILDSVLEGLGISRHIFENDPRWLKLDHVYTRGLRIVNAEILNTIYSSDHFPLVLTLAAGS